MPSSIWEDCFGKVTYNFIWSFFFSALNPCVVCYSRKECSDSKPPSQKKTSDHVKKDRSGIWEIFCLSFILEKLLCCCLWRISYLRTVISGFRLFWTNNWNNIVSFSDSDAVCRAVPRVMSVIDLFLFTLLQRKLQITCLLNTFNSITGRLDRLLFNLFD